MRPSRSTLGAARLALALATAVAALGAAGCGLFEPADSESPSGGFVIVRRDYSHPDSTLATLARAIDAKGRPGALDAYVGGFAEAATHGTAFAAVFDPVTQSRNPGRFPITWGVSEERTFYGQFIQISTNPFHLVWSSDDASGNDEIDDAGGTALLHRRYTVWDSTGATSARRIAAGFADLEMLRPSGTTDWVITRWTDREDAAADFALGERSYGERRLNSSSGTP